MALREQPSTPAVGLANTLKGGTLVAIKDVSKAHQGMHKFPFPIILENFVGDF